MYTIDSYMGEHDSMESQTDELLASIYGYLHTKSLKLHIMYTQCNFWN